MFRSVGRATFLITSSFGKGLVILTRVTDLNDLMSELKAVEYCLIEFEDPISSKERQMVFFILISYLLKIFKKRLS